MLRLVILILTLFSYFCSYSQESFKIEKLKIIAPKFIDREEISYLLGFKEGDCVDFKILKNAAFYLRSKKKFKNIRFKFSSNADGSKRLKLYLNPNWRFMSLRVKGLYFFNSDIVHSYPISIGSSFSLKKHLQFLKNTKTKFYKKGYLDVKIDSFIKKKIKLKEVNSVIQVQLGKKFFIKEIYFDVDNKEIKDFLFKKFNINLLNKRFSFKFLKKISNYIKKYLLKKGYFNPLIKIDFFKVPFSNKVNLICNINLGQAINLNIEGNRYLSSSFIYKNVIKKYSDFPTEIVLSNIKEIYKKEGFFDVDVKIDSIKNSILIDEGKRYKINKIEFVNSNLYSKKQLLIKFRSLLNSFYSESSLEKVIESLSLEYLKQGFWDFVVTDYYLDKKNENTLVLTFFEGTQRFLNSVKVLNYPNIKINIKKPIPFDLSLISSQEKEILQFFYSKGINKVKLTPQIEDEKYINLIWHVDKKENDLQLGKFLLNTNTGIKFKDIKKEIDHILKNRNKVHFLSSVFNRLKSIDSFESLSVSPLNSLDEFGNKPWVVNGINSCKLELKTRLGFQKVNSFKLADIRNRSTYKLGGSVIIRNPLNKGDKFTFDSDFTIFYRHLTTQYSLPFLFNLPIRTIFRLSIDKFYQPLFKGSDSSLYKVSQQSIMSGLSYSFNDFTTFKLGQGFEFRRLSNVSLNSINALKISPLLLDNRIPYVFFEPNYLFEKIDNKSNPTRGFYNLISFKGIKALKDNNLSYARLLAEASAFIPLVRKNIILASRFRVGKIVTGKFESVLPPERFYLGGANSLRSYPTDFAPPLVDVDLCNTPLEAPMGGDFMFNSNLELRLNLIKNFSFVVFQDLGLLSNPYSKSGLLIANGFGFRYLTPVGPLRFDIGFRPKSSKLERNFAWFLTVGQAF